MGDVVKWVLIALGAILLFCLLFGKKCKCGKHGSKDAGEGMTSGPLGSSGDSLSGASAPAIPGQCVNRVSCG